MSGDSVPSIIRLYVLYPLTELFVRLSRTRDNYLFAEGFLPFELSDSLDVPLQTVDFSKRWPQMAEVTRLVKNYNQEVPPLNEALLEECMRELTVSIIAVDRLSTMISESSVESTWLVSMS